MTVRACLLIGLCAVAPGAAAQTSSDPDPGGDPASFSFRYSLKASGLAMRLPDVATLFPDRDSATTFWRLRAEPTVRLGSSVTVDVAVEQRWRFFSAASQLGGAGVLPSNSAAPFRVRQLDWGLHSSAHAEWRAEVDRAAVHVQRPAATLTVGRQAVGWGRGVLFGAIDLFSPFTPLEADREWRRGVDAVRADIKLRDRLSADVVAAFGEHLDESAFAGRIRGYAGKVDVEAVGGRRARDTFAGLSMSAAIGDAEAHGELALFRAPAARGSPILAAPRTVGKVVAGGSYRFGIGHGLLVYAEYHYSGFGVARPEEMLAALSDPGFQTRYLRGDMQIVGRHATAALASYEWSPELTLAGQCLVSPADGSGVAVPTATWTASDGLSVMASGYLPWGPAPTAGGLRSEFGAAPMAAFVQVRLYR